MAGYPFDHRGLSEEQLDRYTVLAVKIAASDESSAPLLQQVLDFTMSLTAHYARHTAYAKGTAVSASMQASETASVESVNAALSKVDEMLENLRGRVEAVEEKTGLRDPDQDW